MAILLVVIYKLRRPVIAMSTRSLVNVLALIKVMPMRIVVY